RVLEPAHPLMRGVPDPFTGTQASHAYFSSVPASALAVASDSGGRVNLVVYRYGAGLVVSGGQTFQFRYDNHQAAGTILMNMIPFAAEGPAGWLSLDPVSGTIPAGGSLDVRVALDATGLNGGDYAADILVQSNDPLTPSVPVPVALHVTG